MNKIIYFLIFIAVSYACYQQAIYMPMTGEDATSSPMLLLSQSVINSAKSAVNLSIGLIGIMAFFLGLLKVAEHGGLLQQLSRLLQPFLVKLFPDIPKNHPAMGAIIMNISANVLGLGNAATPFGIKAMNELNTLNTKKDTATDSMILFLALNTSSVTLIPTGVIALRAASGSSDPAGIISTTLLATTCSTFCAIVFAKLFSKKNNVKSKLHLEVKHYIFILGLAIVFPLLILYGAHFSSFLIPFLILAIMSYGLLKKVAIYESMVEGAKEGFEIAVKIIPFLVTILVAIGMFKASGALQIFTQTLAKLTMLFGLPAEALPMALLRPLSGSGAYGVMASTLQDPLIGPDSYIGYLVSTIQGSTETTFYVLAVYFGSIQIKKLRHALPVALLADLAGIIGAVLACRLIYGHLLVQ